MLSITLRTGPRPLIPDLSLYLWAQAHIGGGAIDTPVSRSWRISHGVPANTGQMI